MLSKKPDSLSHLSHGLAPLPITRDFVLAQF